MKKVKNIGFYEVVSNRFKNQRKMCFAEKIQASEYAHGFLNRQSLKEPKNIVRAVKKI